MEFEGLLYAYKIAKYETIKETSIRLGTSQPSIINKIKVLEEKLGFDVFIKTNKGMILTADGKEFIEGIAPLINCYDLFIKKYNRACKASIVVASNYVTLAQKCFYGVLEKLSSGGSDFKVDSNEFKYLNLPPLDIISGLINREICVGIISISKEEFIILESKFEICDLEVKIIAKSKEVVYLKNKSSIVNKNEITIDDLQNYNNIIIKNQHINKVSSSSISTIVSDRSIRNSNKSSSSRSIAISDKSISDSSSSSIGFSIDMKNIVVNNISEMLITLECDENSFFIGDNLDKDFLNCNNIKTYNIKNADLELYNLLIYNKNTNKREGRIIETIKEIIKEKKLDFKVGI